MKTPEKSNMDVNYHQLRKIGMA